MEKLKSKSPLKWDIKALVFAFVGGFIAIFVLASITNVSEFVFIMAPFGASCVLAFGAWESPLAQPRNIIGGHFIASVLGLIILQLCGNYTWSIALAVGIVIAVMVLTKTTHPPAGADPIIIITTGAGWNFLFFPVLIGAVILTIIALILNRFLFKRAYPKFWY
ncbi:MAG: HPP family protein [Termitinemataceae bacterium]|nr:MAG: HPP family protein [Termitinemataceae bacterium]